MPGATVSAEETAGTEDAHVLLTCLHSSEKKPRFLVWGPACLSHQVPRRAGAKPCSLCSPTRHSGRSVNICPIRELMEGWMAVWVSMQSSSNEAFLKEISLLTPQGSPWPPALLAEGPACITLTMVTLTKTGNREVVSQPPWNERHWCLFS